MRHENLSLLVEHKELIEKDIAKALNPSTLLELFKPKPSFNWFERTFCKALVERVELLEDKVGKLTAKKVKYNKWSNIKTKVKK